jgi:hypothetical protein
MLENQKGENEKCSKSNNFCQHSLSEGQKSIFYYF